jgi:H+/gluconate symporter-like permease
LFIFSKNQLFVSLILCMVFLLSISLISTLIFKKTNKQKNPTKCPKFKCNTVLVSFSACRCSLVVVSSKVGRKKKESGDSSENGICRCGLPARCCQPAVAGGFIYADLGVSSALTWPC